MQTGRRFVALLISAISLSIGVDVIHTARAQPANSQADVATGIIVRFRAVQQGAALDARVLEIQNAAAQRGLSLRYGRPGALGIHVMALDRRLPVDEVDALAQEIEANNPNVEYAEPNAIMYATFTPNDPRYNEQWHYFESTGGIRLPQAWEHTTGSGVTVAVLDTGYRPHVDLNANILSGYDMISDPARANDGDGRDSNAQDPGDACSPNPSSWHGTHVAGTIAAVTNNGTGITGVAHGSKIVPVRVLGECGGTIADIADGIIWASGGSVPGVPSNPNPARVLNLSLGGTGACGSTYQNAIYSARSRNSVIVVAAGNFDIDAANYRPANCSGVVTVAAIDRSGNKASYSNFGTTIEIAAPGGETSPSIGNGVLSTFNTGTNGPGSDSYEYNQGTSMAAPHVSAVAALVIASDEALTHDQVLQTLQSTARPFPGTCSQCGSGIVNAHAATVASGPEDWIIIADWIDVLPHHQSTYSCYEYIDVPNGVFARWCNVLPSNQTIWSASFSQWWAEGYRNNLEVRSDRYGQP